jgi:23S rRNA pseudouridine2457 synthase
VNRYFLINKPPNMVSQFESPDKKRLLGDLEFDFPAGTLALGRLDEHSEGLLILTTEKSLKRRLYHPDHKHKRKYLVQVAGKVTDETLRHLKSGVNIEIKKQGTYTTRPCEVRIISKPHALMDYPHNMKDFIPHTWLEFTLTEGKNRQIRKMCRIVGHKVSRLIRTQIAEIELADLPAGKVREISKEDLYKGLNLQI